LEGPVVTSAAEPEFEQSRVPSGRAERVAQLGWLAGRMALGAAAEGARRLTDAAPRSGHLLLSPANARRLASSLASLRGAAMKLGQILSLEADDLLPPEAAEILATLRDAGDAMLPEQLEGELRAAWGAEWERGFRRFDFDPIAAASIGQVHTATRLDGREVAVKIQYPGVADSIDSDVDNLATTLRLSRLLPGDVEIAPLVAEVKRQLRAEADYESEARHLQRYRSLLADEPRVVVPAVHEDLVTRRVLAMDRLDGVPLEDLCSPEYTDDQRDDAAALLLRLMLRELFEFGFVQSDPNFANYLLLRDGRIGLIDLGAAYEAPSPLCDAYARMFRACLADDRDALLAVVQEIGFVSPADGDPAASLLLDLIRLAMEPFVSEGRYDFGRADLPLRARTSSMQLVFEHGFRRPPPPKTLFLQRKLAGTFLLCARLRARVDARSLLLEALEGRRPS
jgi:predicted unusual protein kinase regulating ubiquinone biosynthesis (AarF/ABC1/UbiB family)